MAAKNSGVLSSYFQYHSADLSNPSDPPNLEIIVGIVLIVQRKIRMRILALP